MDTPRQVSTARTAQACLHEVRISAVRTGRREIALRITADAVRVDFRTIESLKEAKDIESRGSGSDVVSGISDRAISLSHIEFETEC